MEPVSGPKPVVNGLQPKMGPSNGGGRRITVRGDHLGLNADDVIREFYLFAFLSPIFSSSSPPATL